MVFTGMGLMSGGQKVSVVVPADDIKLELLRTRMKDVALQGRRSDQRSVARGHFIEKLLERCSGEVYWKLRAQLKEDEEVADIVTAVADEFILNWFIVPLDRFARVATVPECQDALKKVSPIWRVMGIARAVELARCKEDTPPPDSDAQIDIDDLFSAVVSLRADLQKGEGGLQSVGNLHAAAVALEVELQAQGRATQSMGDVLEAIDALRAELQGRTGSREKKKRATLPSPQARTEPKSGLVQASGPGERASHTGDVIPQTPELASEAEESSPAKTKTPAKGASQAKATSVVVAEPGADATIDGSFDREQKELIVAIGSGKYLTPPIFEKVAGILGITLNKSTRGKLYKKLGGLVSAGLIRKEDLNLNIAPQLRQRTGDLAVSLTEAGVTVYRDLCRKEPVDLLSQIEGKYKSAAAGVMIRLTRELIEEWNSRKDSRWTYEVIDAVWEPDDAFQRIPGAQRSYTTADGQRRALPDLIVQRTPVSGGKPQVAVVEVERGLYKTADLHDKWERAMLCYPPMMVYVVAPSDTKKTRIRSKMVEAWKRVAARTAKRYGLPHGADAAFYTLADLAEFGLLSARHFVSVGYLIERAVEKRDRKGKLTAEERRALRMPRFWNQEKTAGGEQLELV
jgi:hypothetical protein